MGRVAAASHAATLAAKTQLHYASLCDYHLRPYLGSIALREITPEVIGRWQADRLASGAGPVAIRHAMDLLGSILEHAFVGRHLSANPARRVKKARSPRREEVQPLAPGTIEVMRVALDARDATLISILAYAGLRPGEALGLRWGDVREQTLLVQRAISLGEEADTKTRQHRTVRLLAPLAADLRSWRMAAGRPGDSRARVPRQGRTTLDPSRLPVLAPTGVQSGDRGAGLAHARPYDLRHSFASLLLHEGRSVIYVARQLGHDARLTLTRYGHVIDELEDRPRIEAEAAIADARRAVRAAASAAMRDLGS